MRRFHPDYDEQTLILRSTAHACRRLLPQPSKDEKHVEVLKRHLEKLWRANSTRVNGKCMFLKDLIKAMRALHSRRNRTTTQKDITDLVKKHSSL